MRNGIAVAGFVFFALGGVALGLPTKKKAPNPFSAAQQAALEKIIEDYIVQNPLVVKKSLETLMLQEIADQEKEKAAKAKQAIEKNSHILFQDTSVPFLGAQHATQTWVLFTDPYCGYCAKSFEDLERLTSQNSDVKVFVRHVGLLGPESIQAAKALLAAHLHGKGKEFIQALKGVTKPFTSDQFLELAKTHGISAAAFQEALARPTLNKAVADNMALAMELGIEGVPSLVVADKILEGHIPFDQLPLKKRVATLPVAESPLLSEH